MRYVIEAMREGVKDFFLFGLKEARACMFAGSFFVLLFLSTRIPLHGISRYDFLFIAAILIQAILYFTKQETKDEIKVIALFHVIGIILELYKTHPAIGSWSYPEEAFFKIGTVPLYSGFMYAAVGSYIVSAWKLFKLRLEAFPSYGWSVAVCALAYLNFFTNHFIMDLRILLIPIVFVFFRKTDVFFTISKKERMMPLTLSFVLIAFFIWIAENITTYWGAWKYPDQIHAWNAVSIQKIGSWFLLVIISFILVAYLKHVKEIRKESRN